MKIVTIVGARPQFVKAAVVSRAFSLEKNIEEIIIHTGQHFDPNMSDIFFEEMKIPKPKYNLGISGLTHGAMTGEMLKGIEEILILEKPDWVLVYGDTNSTLAGAIAASKLHLKLAHVEAGLRSFNMKMPEEINRILTDRISNILFCPTTTAINNLATEGFEHFKSQVLNVGDVMLDAVLFYAKFAPKCQYDDKFMLATIHRAENTDSPERLNNIFKAFTKISNEIRIVLPLHPRTKKLIEQNKINTKNITIIDPVGYFEMLSLLKGCHMVATDSGGLQKEAYFFNRPCITLREETEWVELVENGYNVLVGTDYEKILAGYNQMINEKLSFNLPLYGNGEAGLKIVQALKNESTH
jgi:UDP-GlcNAc3NAcA epimerase